MGKNRKPVPLMLRAGELVKGDREISRERPVAHGERRAPGSGDRVRGTGWDSPHADLVSDVPKGVLWLAGADEALGGSP